MAISNDAIGSKKKIYSQYRWVILGLAWICQICMTWNIFLIPSLATELYPAFELNQWRYTLVFTLPSMVSIFTSHLGGGLTDRFGIRPMVFISLLISGFFGITRAFAPSFAILLTMTAMLGVGYSFLTPNLSKLVGTWFPPSQIGLATGIYASAQTIGFSIGLLTGPLFQDWQKAFIYVGLITLSLGLIWLIIGRNAPKWATLPKTPITAGIRRALRSRNVILTAVMFLLILGAFQTFSANLAKSLVSVHDISPTRAGSISSLLTWGAMIGTLLIPSLSDRVGLRRPFIYGGALFAAACFYLAWHLAPGGVTIVLILLGGIFLGGFMPILFAIPLELPEIGTRYVGGSTALMNSIGNFGGVLMPFIVAPLFILETSSSYDYGFAVTTALLASVALPAWFLSETGWRKASAHRKIK